jgi:hypothetical protein
MRGKALSSSSPDQIAFRNLRKGQKVYVRLATPERQEYKGWATVLMLRTRCQVNHAITVSFALTLDE